MSVLRFWIEHRQEVATLLAQHIFLVAVSTTIAVLIGVPLGIFAARRPRLAAPFVALANIGQTVPSLAMFGFLLPVPPIGGVGASIAADPGSFLAFLGLYDAVFAILCWASFEYVVSE